MPTMKTIKIFLSSSEELVNDRNAFGNLVRRLDKIYEKRGIRIELFEWEEYDAAYNSCRKQDEYNAHVCASDMFLALFHKKAGRFTIEEFDVATEEFKRTGIKPKPYVYCRELKEGEKECVELKEFKERLFNELGHFWCNYDNRDTLQLNFVMQLLLVENSRLEGLKVDNGEVRLDDMTIARMENLQFAAGNEEYQRMSVRLSELSLSLERSRRLIEKYPEDEDLKDDFQKLVRERNELQEEFEKQQNHLLDTAKRIAKIIGNVLSERMRRAIEAFEKGNVREANIILSEAEHDAKNALADYRQSDEIRFQKRAIVIKSIEELLLKASILMADASIDINERIDKTKDLYRQAVHTAKEIEYNKYNQEEYSKLLYDFAVFLYEYAFYKEAFEVIQEQIELTSDKAKSYNVKGKIFFRLDRYQEAIDAFQKALNLLTERPFQDDELIAATYNHIGHVLNRLGEYDKAIEHAQKALHANCNAENESQPVSARSLENIAYSLWSQGNCKKALENYEKALEIEKRLLGEDSTAVAVTYRNIGDAYRGMSDDHNALNYYQKAFSILDKRLGNRHPETALTLGCLGVAYLNLHQYTEALEYTQKGLAIREETLGMENTQTAESYFWLGEIYSKRSELQNFDKALDYYNKAKEIRIKKYGAFHNETLNIEYAIADLYTLQGKHSAAINFFQAYVDDLEAHHIKSSRIMAVAYYYLGITYGLVMQYDNAIRFLEKAIAIPGTDDTILGQIHLYTASIYKIIGELLTSISHSVSALTILKRTIDKDDSNIAYLLCHIGDIYNEIKDYHHALEYYGMALKIQETSANAEYFAVSGICNRIGLVYNELGNYPESIAHYQKALEWIGEHGTKDVSISDLYNNIGTAYSNQGDKVHALEYFLKALDVKDSISNIAVLYQNVAREYFNQGDLQQALEYYHHALGEEEKVCGKDRLNLVPVYQEMATLYSVMERYSEALEYMYKVLQIHKQALDAKDPAWAVDYETIGGIYFSKGDFSNAVYYYYQCLQKRAEILGPNHLDTAKSFVNYGVVCFYKGNYGTSLEYFQKAQRIFCAGLEPSSPEIQHVQEWIKTAESILSGNENV